MAGCGVIEALVGKLVEKLVEYPADAIKKQVRYLCCYSCNVQTLEAEVGELDIKRQTLQLRVDADRDNCRVIFPEVETWLTQVEDLKTRSGEIRADAEEVKRSCLCKWFPVLHYSLSRKASKTTNDSVQLRNREFPIISTSGIPADIPPVPTTSIAGFESRVSIEDEIMNALKDPSVYSIGIWGIGGVGKTVMAKKIEERVRDEKVCERVVMVVVSQQPDLPKIQNQIAEALRLSLTEESLVLRQRKIHERLVAEKGILIILDDLWKRLDLEEIGIPSQSIEAGCKLILTSRNKNDLTSTGIPDQNIFQLGILTEEESWRFFKDNAGIDDSQHELVQTAKKVERECMGLPLALKIVACALKGKSIAFWNNAIRELEKHLPDDIPGVAKEVYGSLQFSINALEGKKHKDLFLLCCLFPEDYFISIEELLRCVMGLRIFGELENLTEARDKVETVLNILLCRSLLIEGDEKWDNFNVRMHDVIRDVGIWIATKGIEKHVFLIKHGVDKWPTVEDDSSYPYTCISLLFSPCKIIFPESIVFPKLEFLRLNFVWGYSEDDCVELPENFFNGMSGLRFFEVFKIGLLPPSMCRLNNVRTLSLNYCKIFESTSVLGKLTNLEMLSLIGCQIKVLPVEIGGLKKLKLMDISKCRSLKRIAFGVVSGLVRLEELVILDSFDNWVAEEAGGQEDVACLSELNSLKNLTTLKIKIRNPSVVPKPKPLWVQKLKKYDIVVSNCSFKVDFEGEKGRFQKSIFLGKEVVNPLEDWIYNMASDAEYVNLEGCNCMKFVKGLSENSWNLSCLKQLRISDFTNIQYLVEGQQNNAIFTALESLCIKDSTILQQIFEVSPQIGTFEALQRIHLFKLPGLVCLWKFSTNEQLNLSNLQKVEIKECDNLAYLFSLSVVQSLVQLTSLLIRNCGTIKEIFKKENGEWEEINEIKLPKLRQLYFQNLDNFYGLCGEIDRIELPELHELEISDLPRMKMAEGDSNEVHQKYLFSKVDNVQVQVMGISINFCVLQRLSVSGIGNFKCMFSPSVILSELPNLWKLSISGCSMLEEVIEKDNENVGREIIFPNLHFLELSRLPNIRTFCYNAIQFPSLWQLHVKECPLMLKFVEGLTDDISSSRSFLDKQVQCPKVEELSLHRLNISGVFSPLFFKSLTVLKKLELIDYKELELVDNFFSDKKVDNVQVTWISINFCVLQELTMSGIGNFKCIFSPSVIISGLPNLRNLSISDCSMLEEVIGKDNENVGREIIFPNLYVLKLLRLPNIRTFCYNAIQFPSLESLNVGECPLMLKFVEGLTDDISSSKPFLDKQVQCPKLEELSLHRLNISGVFSPLFFKSLTVLKKLELIDCKELEHVITKEEGSNTTNTEEDFIQKIPLTTFKLIHMPKLCGSIFQIKHNLEFSLLKEIEIKDCPMLEKFSLGSLRMPKLKSVTGLWNNELVDNFFSDKVDNIQVTWISINFCVLHELTMSGIGNFKCMCSPSIIIFELRNLWKLSISDCSMLEEVIGKDNENVGRAIIFPNLWYLNLLNLPNIRTFCYNAIQFPSLKLLHVEECPLMRKFVEGLTDDISSSRPFLDKQVQCPKLERLTLNGLNISGAFSPLFFKSLTALTHLHLKSCEGLEHMITKEEGPTTTNTEEESITKIPLVRLTLIQMPKLCGSIFQIKHNLEFPWLEHIEIKICPMLEKISLGSVHLPKLKSVSGLLSAKSIAKFFSNKEMVFGEIHSENNCFIISPKDISFSSNQEFDFLVLKSSGSFFDVVSIALNVEAKEIVGKFKIEKIRIGIEYEVRLVMMLPCRYEWKDPIEIELKLPEESKLQHAVILENHPKDTWIEISIGKFVGEESQQNKQLEFSLRKSISNYFYSGRRLYVGGIRIVEV